jgi:competence protein ComFC
MPVAQSRNATRICKVCFKDIIDKNLHSLLTQNVNICRKCNDKFLNYDKIIRLGHFKCRVLYQYNDFLKEQLYKLKGCGDIELSSIFLEYKLIWLRLLYGNYVIVPIPSNEEDDLERGFNHVIEIYKPLKLRFAKAIIKNCKFKQSDLSKLEREKVSSKLSLVNNLLIKNKNILLVDDVITTGSTMKACINLLKNGGAKHIVCLAISHPIDKL